MGRFIGWMSGGSEQGSADGVAGGGAGDALCGSMPKSADRFEDWMKQRFPTLHDVAAAQLERFVDDFQRRYPPGAP